MYVIKFQNSFQTNETPPILARPPQLTPQPFTSVWTCSYSPSSRVHGYIMNCHLPNQFQPFIKLFSLITPHRELWVYLNILPPSKNLDYIAISQHTQAVYNSDLSTPFFCFSWLLSYPYNITVFIDTRAMYIRHSSLLKPYILTCAGLSDTYACCRKNSTTSEKKSLYHKQTRQGSLK